MIFSRLLLVHGLLLFFACKGKSISAEMPSKQVQNTVAGIPVVYRDSGVKTIHIFVALCDNKYQGIVPVPAAIGNGQDPVRNLYWGAGYGVKSYFSKKSSEWQLLAVSANPSATILERLLFKHKTQNVFLLADAYNGKFIKETTLDFLRAAAGRQPEMIRHEKDSIRFGGAADLIAYVGHDGLMDFSIEENFVADKNSNKKEAIILACYSKHFFSPHLKYTGTRALVWTTGLMAPEAYTLYDAIHARLLGQSSASIQLAAASAYAKYQKCGLKAAQRLLVGE